MSKGAKKLPKISPSPTKKIFKKSKKIQGSFLAPQKCQKVQKKGFKGSKKCLKYPKHKKFLKVTINKVDIYIGTTYELDMNDKKVITAWHIKSILRS